ncbi:MAG TPA: GlsB/YeaQ/YmgE family stress response membrane protein [Chthoniobacterales bacterium]|nr:GlsB/YeaQ/YmgE family stress response membrane protein [Chthoniobacterales bacterium]
MLHIIWYIIVGLIAGVVAKSAMHTHMSFLLTIALGIVGSVVGGLITHLIFRPKEGAPFHPAGIIVSILGAILVLFVWNHFNLHMPTG